MKFICMHLLPTITASILRKNSLTVNMKDIHLCLTLCNPMDWIPWNFPGQNTGMGSLSLLHGIFPTQVSCIADGFFTSWATREAHSSSLPFANWMILNWFLYLWNCAFSSTKREQWPILLMTGRGLNEKLDRKPLPVCLAPGEYEVVPFSSIEQLTPWG